MPPFAFKQASPEETPTEVASNDPKYGVEYVDDNPVSVDEWKEYVATGKISEVRMYSLIYKKKNNVQMTDKEMQMFSSSDKSKEIESKLKSAMEAESRVDIEI